MGQCSRLIEYSKKVCLFVVVGLGLADQFGQVCFDEINRTGF